MLNAARPEHLGLGISYLRFPALTNKRMIPDFSTQTIFHSGLTYPQATTGENRSPNTCPLIRQEAGVMQGD